MRKREGEEGFPNSNRAGGNFYFSKVIITQAGKLGDKIGWKGGDGMKPRAKNDSWHYPASKTPARKRVRRIANKRHRRADHKLAMKEMEL